MPNAGCIIECKGKSYTTKDNNTMGTTSDFVKLRSTKAPKVGEWNKNYGAALGKAR